jgi:hypothetical protein
LTFAGNAFLLEFYGEMLGIAAFGPPCYDLHPVRENIAMTNIATPFENRRLFHLLVLQLKIAHK